MIRDLIRSWLGIEKNEDDLLDVRLNVHLLNKTVRRVEARSFNQDNDIINIMDKQKRLEQDYPLSTQPLEDV